MQRHRTGPGPGWAPITGFTCDFNDGTPPNTLTDLNQDCPHTYATAGLHRFTVTETDSGGNTATTATLVLPGRHVRDGGLTPPYEA